MTSLTLQVHGDADIDTAWERYADLALWSTWAPQIQRVDADSERLHAGLSGTVRAGLLPRPTLPVRFEVLAVDEARREWTWRAHVGPISMLLDHGVVAEATGSSTWLRVSGPLPVVAPYAPLARIALRRLVAA